MAPSRTTSTWKPWLNWLRWLRSSRPLRTPRLGNAKVPGALGKRGKTIGENVGKLWKLGKDVRKLGDLEKTLGTYGKTRGKSMNIWEAYGNI